MRSSRAGPRKVDSGSARSGQQQFSLQYLSVIVCTYLLSSHTVSHPSKKFAHFRHGDVACVLFVKACKSLEHLVFRIKRKEVIRVLRAQSAQSIVKGVCVHTIVKNEVKDIWRGVMPSKYVATTAGDGFWPVGVDRI